MSNPVAEGSRSIDGMKVTTKRVPELLSEEAEAARHAGAKPDQPDQIASPEELDQYDATIFGTPIRFGNMAAQMRNFLDQTGSLWLKGALIGRVASVFTSTGTGGGNESTILTLIPTFGSFSNDEPIRGRGAVPPGATETVKGQRSSSGPGSNLLSVIRYFILASWRE